MVRDKGDNWRCPFKCSMMLRSDDCGGESMTVRVTHISWPAGTVITESKQRSLSKVTTLLCSGASVVEWTPDQCQDSWVTRHSHLFRPHLDSAFRLLLYYIWNTLDRLFDPTVSVLWVLLRRCSFGRLYEINCWGRKSTEQRHTGREKEKSEASFCFGIKVDSDSHIM